MKRGIFRKIINGTKPIPNPRIGRAPIPRVQYQNKPVSEYKIEIPTNIFQTWHTKNLPPLMFQACQKIKQHNPRFHYFLFDDNECREFIRKNFEPDVLNAYDRLIPGAYKADLWRYCILYKRGGIYLDIKYVPINGFRCINLLEKEHFTLDFGGGGVYNAVMVCKPGNEILLKCIHRIVENVKHKFYGNDMLEPTGPNLLGKFFSDQEKNAFDLRHEMARGVDTGKDSDRVIMFNGHPIFRCYDGYFAEREKYSIKQHYGALWKEKRIYL